MDQDLFLNRLVSLEECQGAPSGPLGSLEASWALSWGPLGSEIEKHVFSFVLRF